MSIRSLRAGRQNYDPVTYTGVVGEVFYNEATGEFRLCDAVTPGGIPLPIAPSTVTTVGGIRPGAGFTVTGSGVLNLNAGPMFELDESDVFQLLPGTADQIGGIKAGEGVVIAADGTLTINLDNVEDFSFGDFTATVGTYTDTTEYALLGSVNADEDIVIASNGDGGVKVVGDFAIHATNGTVTGSLETDPFFRVQEDGQVRILVPTGDAAEGGLEIIGSDTGDMHPPNQTGVILHTTGNTDVVNRTYLDAVNNYAIIVGRRYNGEVGDLENVKDGEVFFRIAGQASTGTDFETFGPGKINWIATEDQGPTNQGGKITIDVTANGTAAFGNVVTAAEFTATGVVSTVGFVGDLTGNADTVTNGVYTTDTGTVTNTMLAGSIANAKLANSTISGIALGSDLESISAGNYLTGSDYNGGTAQTFAVDATATNIADKVVARDSSGDFAAGVITADLVGDVTGNADTVTNGVYTTDTGTVTNTMLANSSITINGDSVSLGGTITIDTGETYTDDGSTTDINGSNVVSVVNLPNDDIGPITTLLFDTTHTHTTEPEGTICWSSADGTLNIVHADGVVQQVGQELYAYARNATGSEIANGACVRFAGAEMPDGEARLLIAPFEADGTFPNLYGLGIATQTLSDDEDGRVCVWGKVRGINTTGTPVSETWIVGDILYAHPSTEGALTKVKPTAPNNVVPVAAVLAVDATDGELFVRPTVEQKMSYGVFTRTSDLSASNNTPTVVDFDTAEISNGVSIVSNSRATVDQSGLYQIEWTLHWDSQGTGFGTDPVYTFLRKNGTDVPNTLRRNSVSDFDPAGQTFTFTRTLSLDADDYIEVVIVTTGGDVDLEYVAAITSPFTAPATAAAELTVAQIQL